MSHEIELGLADNISPDARYRAFMRHLVKEVSDLYQFDEVFLRSNVHKTGSTASNHKVGKLRLTCNMRKKGEKKWNAGIHINIVRRRENGPAWIDNINSRGPNFPYHEFTWGSITWGSGGNPNKSYGTKKSTTKDEAMKQYASVHGSSSSSGMGHASGSSSTGNTAVASSSGYGTYSAPVPAIKKPVVYQDMTFHWDDGKKGWYWNRSTGESGWADAPWAQYCEKQQTSA